MAYGLKACSCHPLMLLYKLYQHQARCYTHGIKINGTTSFQDAMNSLLRVVIPIHHQIQSKLPDLLKKCPLHICYFANMQGQCQP